MPLIVSLIQTNLYWEDKKRNLQMLEDKIMNIQEKTQIVILPEMFSTGFSMKPELLAETMQGESVKWMQRIATTKKVIVTGSLIIKEISVEGIETYYNRLIWMLPNGQYGTYDKRHLFTYAGEHGHYTPGSKRFIAAVNGWRIQLQICYDLRFPVWARQQLQPDSEKPEYDVLIYVANWPEKRIAAWNQLLPARAIENQCFVIGVNRVGADGNGYYHSGDSQIINPMGEQLYYKQHEEDIFTLTLQEADLENPRTRFPFWEDGEFFKIS